MENYTKQAKSHGSGLEDNNGTAVDLLHDGESTSVDWMWSLAAPAICTAVTYPFHSLLHHTNLAMIYLAGVCFVACNFSRAAAVTASVLSGLCFDFFFIEPRFQFAHSDAQYLIALCGMVLVALTISAMASRIRKQKAAAVQRAARTSALYKMTRELVSVLGPGKLGQAALRHIVQVFSCRAAILIPDGHGTLVSATNEDDTVTGLSLEELAAAQQAFNNKSLVNVCHNETAQSNGLYLPLIGSQHTMGVLAVFPSKEIHKRLLEKEHFALLEAFANTIALALERAKLAEEAARAWLQVETERTRNALLSSVSHDLRTPLAAIAGAASSMLNDSSHISENDRRELLQSIFDESERLNRRLRNLLNMTRLESGGVKARKEWQSLEEVVGAVLHRLEKRAATHKIQAKIPAGLPLVPFDDTMIEQVLINLMENATKYAPAGSTITISANTTVDTATVEVSNDGPGLPSGEELKIFDKFYRSKDHQRTTSGTGLGLAICKGIIEAHGGKIWVENKASGPCFIFTLPIEGSSPVVQMEENATV